MKHKTDYKKNKVLNLTDYIPFKIKERIIEGMSDNILNRFMTKPDFGNFNGYIGTEDGRSELNKIPERTEARSKNQLQPIINASIATENHHLTFQDFLRKLERTGVNVEDFNEWGKSQQFNWVPPVNIDKLINYRDYYWNREDGTPQYITIKNEEEHINALYDEIKKSYFDRMEDKKIIVNELDDIPSLLDRGIILFDEYEENKKRLAIVENDIIVPMDTDLDLSEVNTNQFVKLTEDIINLEVDDGHTEVTVNGNFSNSDLIGVISSIVDVDDNKQHIFEIKNVIFDEDSNITKIILDGELSSSINADLICFQIKVLLEHFHYEYVNKNTKSYSPIEWYNIGQYLFYNEVEVFNSSTNLAPTSADIGTKEIIDSSVNFDDILSDNMTYVIDIKSGPNIGVHDIISFNGDTLNISERLFPDINVEYSIYKISFFDNIKYLPNNPQSTDSVYDSANDKLFIYDGSTYKVVAYGVDKIIRITDGDRKYLDNDWTRTNKWTHKSQLSTFGGKIQASMPIIEYNNDIELSKTSKAEYQWRYSRDSNTSYRKVDVTPTLFELQPVILGGDLDQFRYLSPNRIELDEKYGNLEKDIKIGDRIIFSNFENNSGTYEVSDVEYVISTDPQTAPKMEIEFTTSLINLSDYTEGGVIHPEFTTMGDKYDVNHEQWQFAGVKSITSTSVTKEPNPQLDVLLDSTFASINGQDFDIMIGPTWEELAPRETYQATRVLFDNRLREICLIEDYQEGDLRVYINGIRRYDIFEEIPDNDNIYVIGIQFNDDIVLSRDHRVRIELGEAFKDDMGKNSVDVFVGGNSYERDYANLVEYRVVEQEKIKSIQYPNFKLYDVFGDESDYSNSIFKFKEDANALINAETSLRLLRDFESQDFTFEQQLFKGDSEKLLCYSNINDNEINSIWKRGWNNEIQIPQKIGEDWDIPNSWYYNIKHKNYRDITLREVFRHFNTIINGQENKEFFANATNRRFHAHDITNYGLGGTIKEHNDGLDLLASFALMNHTSVPRMIDFARTIYQNQVNEMKNYTLTNIKDWIEDPSTLSTHLINYIENNKKFNIWFGDTSAFDGDVGIKSFISTGAILGIIKPSFPCVIDHLGQQYIRHHDGHLSVINFNINELINKLSNVVQKKQVVKTENSAYLPEVSDFNTGDLFLQIVQSTKSFKIFILNNASWEEVDLIKAYSNALKEVEDKLFDIARRAQDTKYNFENLKKHKKFSEYIEQEFINYTNRNFISDPLSNELYQPNDPWTWNYAYTPITADPKNYSNIELGIGSWQAIYEYFFNTPYPHKEPWKLQGFDYKPHWWDSEYVDESTDRIWSLEMWDNIRSGVIPQGEKLPNGLLSNGAVGLVDTYEYIVVNISDDVTSDGILPDELIPPVWSSNNTNHSGMRAIYEKNENPIISPQSSFLFGQLGYVEWEWKSSISYSYDLMKVAYYLDPMKFVHRNFGNHYTNVSCLQVNKETENVFSHEDTIFHGELSDNQIYKIPGIFQWFVQFNRYYGFDGSSIEYRDLWTDWDMNLGYTFDNVINSDTFDIKNESLDLTNRDYSLELKKTEGLDDFWFKPLKAEAIKVPSLISKDRELSSDWINRITPISPETEDFTVYHPENYPIKQVSDTEFKLYNYELLNAGIELPRTRLEISYDILLNLNTEITGYDPSTVYTAEIETLDGTIELNINSDEVNIVNDLIEKINENIQDQMPDSSTATVEGGNIILYGVTSLNDNGLFGNILSSTFSEVVFTDSYSFNGFFDITIEAEKYFKVGNSFEIANSTNFNGSYKIIKTFTNIAEKTLRVFVEGSGTTVSDSTVDGYAIPENARTIPWETGQEVFLNTTGRLPDQLLDYVPYYIIKKDDYTFKLAETKNLAEEENPITVNDNGVGNHKIGRVRNTFKPLTTEVDFSWRRHFYDKREPFTITGPTTISSIQTLTDLILGYDEYLQDIGIQSTNEKMNNVDEEVGRARGWKLELEKYIAWLFTFRSIKNKRNVEFTGSINNEDNTIEVNGHSIPWDTGTPISIKEFSNVLPNEISQITSQIKPYYAIVTSTGTLKLATSKQNAKNGMGIEFTGGEGDITFTTFRTYKKVPSQKLNPYVKQVTIDHEIGTPANFTKSDSNIITAQRLYDDNLRAMTLENVLFFRNDLQSVIETRESSETMMGGGHVVLDGLEHIILFNNYSIDNSLIYDPFIGINTPRFFLEFVKPLQYTQRPTLSGMVLRGDTFYSSIEKAVSDIRYYYDTYESFEKEDSTTEARKSLGYQGRKQYLDNLGINSKSQFIFWKGFIQSKGTKATLDALTNHRFLDGINVDEFWAYRKCSFGSSQKKIYPEMRLFSDDVVSKELRLEFSPPTGGTIGDNYTQVRLVDRERWNNQPDLLDSMSPNRAYYFDIEVSEFFEDVTQFWITQSSSSFFVQENPYLPLNYPVGGVEIYYTNSQTGERQRAIENIDYEMVNTKLVKFHSDAFFWDEITLAGLTYNYKGENPATIIDVKNGRDVISQIPIWHPALGQHNPIGYYAVDVEQGSDPARYNISECESQIKTKYWSSNEVGKIWLDSTLLQYIPYYDKSIFPSINDRSIKWGELAEFGSVDLYQWIETDIPPSDYDDISASDEQSGDKPISERVTGKVRKDIYKNVDGSWVKDKNIVIPFFKPEFSISTIFELYEFLSEMSMESIDIEIYVNGKLFDETTFRIVNVTDILNIIGLIPENAHITIVKKIHSPTQEELENGEYLIDIPHTVVEKYDPIKQDVINKYYYWVTDLKSENLLNDQSLTLFDAKREIETMNGRPYMFVEGFNSGEAGYGILYGSTFDPDDPQLPPRYTQCIVKGLKQVVRDNDRYVLRFLKDYTLRDQLKESDLSLSNKHWQWKLFRKNQPFKIDEFLWKKVIESAVGYRLDDDYNILFDEQIPSLERKTYDLFFPDFSSRIGLGADQVLVDQNNIIDLIIEVLTSPITTIETVDNIKEFIGDYNLSSVEEIVEMLRTFYDMFSPSEVNNLFFEILYESMRLNPKHEHFFKTSWVAIDIESKFDSLPENIIDIPSVFPSEHCFLDDEIKEKDKSMNIMSNGINSKEVNSGQTNM